MSAKKTLVKIYKINTAQFRGKTIDVIPAEIIKRANTNQLGNKRFTPQKLNEGFAIPEDFTFEVYHALKEGEPGWVGAWTDILDDEANMLTKKNTMSSFIVFITRGKNLYAVTGGQGNFSISPYVESFFGLDVVDRLLESTQDRGIAEASKSGVTGNVKSESRTFYDLTDGLSQDSFETFFKQLKSKIDIKIVKDYFGDFYPNKDYTSFFQGGDYFLIRKSIDISKIFELIIAIEKVFAERKSSGHNKLVPVGSVTSDKSDFVKVLNEAFLQEMFQNQAKPEKLNDYYFAPKSIPEQHIDGAVFVIAENNKSASTAKIYAELPKLSDYIETLLNYGSKKPTTFKRIIDFTGAIQSIKILWKHEEEDSYHAIDTFDSINGVMKYQDKSYLRFEGKWYEMRDNFTEIIDSEFSKLISNPKIFVNKPSFLRPWTSGTEDDYNYGYLTDTNVMVAHKVMKRDNAKSSMEQDVEYSDLIHLDAKEPKMLHVKKECNGEMRIASAQIHMCAQKFNRDGKEAFLREYYKLIASRTKTASQVSKISENDFVTLGMNDSLQVGVILSDKRMSTGNPNDFSVIGKFYIVKMYKDLDSLKFADKFRIYNVIA